MTTSTEIPTTASFNSKAPHTTLWIELRFPVGAPPEELLAELAAAGFVEDGLAKAPPLDGVDYVQLGKSGSALFGGWSEEEHRANSKQARAILKRHGFTVVPHNKLEWQDLI